LGRLKQRSLIAAVDATDQEQPDLQNTRPTLLRRRNIALTRATGVFNLARR
jgi:hypothetical protein